MNAQANNSGSLGPLHLAAFLRDAPSVAAIRALMEKDGHAFDVQNGTVTDAAKYLADNSSPEVLVVEITSAEQAPKQLDKLADLVNPQTKVIVTGKIDTYSFYAWLMGLGIHDYLLQPITEANLTASLAKGSQAAATASSAPEERKLIAVIGARGGVGTTTIATHLASIFAKEHRIPTALLDPDAHFGSVALSFDLEPARGLKDALEKPDRIDSLFLERVMVKPFANLSILSAEEVLHEAVNPQPGAGEALIGALHEQFPIVIVDLPRQITTLAHYVLAQADAVVLVAEPSLLNLRDALRIKDYLVDTLKRPAPLTLINRRGQAAGHELSKKDFTKHFGAAPIAELPYLAEVVAAVSQGEMLLDNAKAKSFTDPLRALAAKLIGKKATTHKAEKKDPLPVFLNKILRK